MLIRLWIDLNVYQIAKLSRDLRNHCQIQSGYYPWKYKQNSNTKIEIQLI